MSANDEDWEVVNYGQKKQQKAQKRKDNKQAVKLREQQEKDEEEARRKAAEEAFYQQYVLSKEKSSSDNDVGSVYSRAFKGIAKRQSQHLNNDMLLPDSDDEDSGLKKKSKAKKSNKPKKPSPKTVAKTIDNQQLKSLLVQYSERFPSNYDVQLKNLAEQFETIFTTADAKKEKKDDKPYVESLDTPMFYLEKDVIETVENWLSKMPEDAVVGYFWFLVTTFISVSIEKSSQIQINGLGIKILIQIIARRFPNAVLRNINPIKQTYTDSNNQKENSVPILKQNVSPIFLWIFGQLLNKTPGAALTVWFQFLLPLLQEQKTASTVKENSIQFVEIAVQNAKNKNGLLDEVNGLVAYERLLSYISSDKGFPARVQSLLPKLLDVNYLFGKGKVPKKLFTLLLSQSASSKQEFRDTVLKSLVSCLSTDSKSFSYWNEIYPNYIAQSNNLLLFITLNWDKEKLSQQFKAKDMIETSKKFTTVNQQLLEGTFVPADKKNKKPKKLNAEEVKEVNMVDATCKALRKKLQSAAKKEEIAESKTGNKEEKSQGTSTLTAILPLSFLVVGVAAYAVLNCCQQEWCSSIGFMNDLMKCP